MFGSEFVGHVGGVSLPVGRRRRASAPGIYLIVAINDQPRRKVIAQVVPVNSPDQPPSRLGMLGPEGGTTLG